ncbi:MAG TPA: adenosylhomocysteinase [Chloroflexota bacterium]|nr:adenosylhomocysteinase [Chloroflexota bacterium]
MSVTSSEYDVKDLALAERGLLKVEWAGSEMPVLKLIGERFRRERPLEGLRLSACLHVTSETANLAVALRDGGAQLALCASNPLSTQDDVAAALAGEYGIPTYAIKGEDETTYYQHIEAALANRPNLTMDDGADLVTVLHIQKPELLPEVIGGTEETTTGVIRLKSMARQGALKYPIIAVNEAMTKHFFDNRYGTGQSTLDGVIRATNVLLAGKKFVVVGYGWCGRGVASRARGLGAQVIVTEVDPVRALEALMDGYQVMPIAEAVERADIVITVTGNLNVIDSQHVERLKDGAILANSGHFNDEINIPAIEERAQAKRRVREFVEEYRLADGRRIYLLAEGRLVNLSAAEGHPAAVMDMSFANQALATEYIVKNAERLNNEVYVVPEEIDREIARLKLVSMGVEIDTLTDEQSKYLASWEQGT